MTKDTPRTDNEDHWFVDRDESGLLGIDTVRADFARELERDLTACRAALRELVACNDNLETARMAWIRASSGSVAAELAHDKRNAAFDALESAWVTARAILPSDTTGEGEGK